MPEPRNPFHWRGTVKSNEAFIGRKSELESISDRLRNLGCTSVVGERRIGKSSLIYQAYHRALLCGEPVYRTVRIDMLSAAHHTLKGLLVAIAEGLGETLELVEGMEPPEMLAELERAVRRARGNDVFPVLFIDEFEHLAGRMQAYGDNVLESWRSLCNDGQMAMVTASQQSLEMITRKERYTSPFFNLFAQEKLGEFTEAEAREFGEWTRRAGGFDGQHVAFILKEGRQHPLRLMVSAYHLFEAKQRGEVDYEALRTQVQNSMGTMLGQQ